MRQLLLTLMLTAVAFAVTLPSDLAWIAQTPGLKPFETRSTYNVGYAVTGDGAKQFAAVREGLVKQGWSVTDKPAHDMVRDGKVWMTTHKELRAVKNGHAVEVFLSTVNGRPDWPAPILQVGLADWNLP